MISLLLKGTMWNLPAPLTTGSWHPSAGISAAHSRRSWRPQKSMKRHLYGIDPSPWLVMGGWGLWCFTLVHKRNTHQTISISIVEICRVFHHVYWSMLVATGCVWLLVVAEDILAAEPLTQSRLEKWGTRCWLKDCSGRSCEPIVIMG